MTSDNERRCLSGEHCKNREPITNRGAHTPDPLCPDCLDVAERDVRALVYDYLDLAQLHEASMSQAINEKTGGSKDSPMLIAGHVEALQAEIVHVLTTWEYEVRVAAHLSDPHIKTPIADWHTTLTRPVPLPKMRAGAQVQRAVTVLGPRLRILSLIGPTAVCPTGVEDEPADVAGWEAVHQLEQLHRRARGQLGRTRRAFWVAGDCPKCSARCTPDTDGPLYRSEPAQPHDPLTICCTHCHMTRPYVDYEHYMSNLTWPEAEPVAA